MHFVVTLFASAVLSGTAGVDCHRASKPDERTICANAQLSQLEVELTGAYASVLPLVRGEARAALVADQRQWLRRRAQCGSNVDCLKAVYDRRNDDLQALFARARRSIATELFRKIVQCADCDLTGAVLSRMQPAQDADNGLLDCTITGVAHGTFDRARIDHSNFVSCNTKADSALSTMSWDGASLKGTDFTGSNLSGNSFTEADLTGANLTGTSLHWVDMEGATLVNANLQGARSEPDAMNDICSNFANANFSGAKLENAILCGDLRGANFTRADMRGVRLSGYAHGVPDSESDPDSAVAQEASFAFGGKINLTRADLRGATLFGETALTNGGYAFAILCRTIMPDGQTSDRDCD